MARHLESQLDFIFFFYGLSFILLGALCLVLARGREDDRGTTIRLIGLFGCVHGANEWLDMLALIAGDSSEFLVVRAAVLTASFVLLAEAGRNGGITRDLAMPGPWIYIPILVAIGAIGFVDGIESAKAATRYLLAAPGAILVAFTVFTGRHHDLHMNRSLMAGVAIAFALYAVAAGMIVETAPFWPARTFNQEMFQRVTGVPIQLVRGLIAVALAALIWAAWGRRVMETLDYPGYSLHLKRQFVGVLTTLLLVLALGWALTDYLGEIHRDDVESEAAGDVALLVSGLERETTIADAMVKAIAASPSVQLLLGDRESGRVTNLSMLEIDAGVIHAMRGLIVNRAGDIVGSSDSSDQNWLGMPNLRSVDWFEQAIAGRPVHQIRVDPPQRVRTYLTASPIRDAQGEIQGIAMLEISLETLAELMTRFDQAFFVVDARGLVIITNRRDELFRTLWPRPDLPRLQIAEQFGASGRTMLAREIFGGDWVEFGGRRSYVLRQPIDSTQMSLVLVIPVKGIFASRLLGIIITLQVAIAVLFYFFGMDRGVRDRFERKLREELLTQTEDLARQAATDSLTGLANRMKFDARLNEELARSQRSGRPFSLIIFDIDHFKEVNDIYGHPVGDQVLVRLSRTVGASVRQSDLLARWGGEEFVILLADTEAAAAYETAKKLRLLVAHTIFEHVGTITASFGVAQVTPGDHADTLVARADNALYRAKLNGRNRVELSLPVIEVVELSPTA